jgi:hypothetical protein
MEITRKELDRMRARRSEADINLVFAWLKLDGEIQVVDSAPESKDANLEGKVEALEPAS